MTSICSAARRAQMKVRALSSFGLSDGISCCERVTRDAASAVSSGGKVGV